MLLSLALAGSGKGLCPAAHQTAQFGSFSVGPKELQALLESARAPFLSMKPPLLALESTLPSF